MIPRALTPAAFAARRPGASVRRFSGRAMGTSWSLQAVHAPTSAGEGVRRALDRVVRQMSQWEAESDLSRLNRAPAGEWRAIPPEFARVMAAATAIAEASDGAFNPALGLLTERWGFGAGGPVAAAPDIAPPEAPPDIAFDAATARVRRGTGAALDLSGIAKGFGVDLAAEHLLASGVRHFLIEVGGELRGEGVQPDGQPWWVDVEPPPGMTLAPWRPRTPAAWSISRSAPRSTRRPSSPSRCCGNPRTRPATRPPGAPPRYGRPSSTTSPPAGRPPA